MNFFSTKYMVNNIIVNKITISDECWIMAYNDLKKTIVTRPMKISHSTFETINSFCIKETKEELMFIIKELGLSEITHNYQTVIDRAIEDVSNYTSRGNK